MHSRGLKMNDKERTIWAEGIKAMAACLKAKTDPILSERRQAETMMRNTTGEEKAIATARVIMLDKEMKAWLAAYKKVTHVVDFA